MTQGTVLPGLSLPVAQKSHLASVAFPVDFFRIMANLAFVIHE